MINQPKPSILVLDDDEDILSEVAEDLNDWFNVTCVTTLVEARRALRNRSNDKEYSVVVADMQLEDDAEGGLRLSQELNERKVRPEVIVLTAFPGIPNASKCMQAGTFGYVEKAGPDSYDQVEKLCIKANDNWHRQNRRIPDSIMHTHLALLFGDVKASTELKTDIEEALRRVVDRSIQPHQGYITKRTTNGFLAVFETVARADKAAHAIKTALTRDLISTPAGPLELRQAIHWGAVRRVEMKNRHDVIGLAVVQVVKLADEQAEGEIFVSQEARKAMQTSEKGEVQSLPPPVPPKMNEPDPSTAQGTELPDWIAFALKSAEEIKRAGSELPSDLAEHHDNYAHGKPTS